MANTKIENTIQFRIDTGCDVTIISPLTDFMMKINFNNSEIVEVMGIGGKVLANKINNCGLYFFLGNYSLTEWLDYVLYLIHFKIIHSLKIFKIFQIY